MLNVLKVNKKDEILFQKILTSDMVETILRTLKKTYLRNDQVLRGLWTLWLVPVL